MSTSNVTLILILILNLMLFTCVTSSRKATLPPKRGSSGAHSLPAVVPGPAKQGSPSESTNNNKCPKDTVKLGACGSWLGLVTEVVGTKPSEECCTVVKGLADLEAALCMCSVVKASLAGLVTLDTPIALSLLVNGCGKKIPDGFSCA